MRRILVLVLTLAACAAPRVDHAAVDRAVEQLQARKFAAGVVDEGVQPSAYLDRARARMDGALLGEPAHEVAILETGQDALVARLHLIRSARESIDFQTFSWGDDDSSRAIYWEFVAAARRGVRVRLLVDQLGLGGTPDVLAFTTIVDSDLQLKLYNVLSRRGRNDTENMLRNALGNFQHMNHRMHNKLLVVDGAAAIIGGRNVDDRYFDMDPDWLYVDRDVIVSGPVVEDMAAAFDEYWKHPLATPAQYLVDVAPEILEFAAQESAEIELDVQHPDRIHWAFDLAAQTDLYSGLVRVTRHDVSLVELVVDPPSKNRELDPGAEARSDRLMREALELTRESLLVQSNYLVLTSGARRGLNELRKERPDLELAFLTNSLAATGAPYVYAISRKQRRNLVRKSGMEIYELKPRPSDPTELVPRYAEVVAEDPDGTGPTLAIHAKSFIVDDEIALIGSHNFDPRSASYNTEGGVLIHDRELAAELEASMRRVMSPNNSWAVARKPRVWGWRQFNSFMQGISRPLPILDVWPARYTTAYDLRDGETAVRSVDPTFYDRYQDVGELPETDGKKRTVTRLTSVFGGFAEPLM
ncbi:MAG: phospholipase D family protein [Planctomycetes bacterium]|nr:phospholipase D family protein [Planctomycetota bacterium]MCB9904510.1 phospholipase D family protein [Planctomycetota bacterium]